VLELRGKEIGLAIKRGLILGNGSREGLNLGERGTQVGAGEEKKSEQEGKIREFTTRAGVWTCPNQFSRSESVGSAGARSKRNEQAAVGSGTFRSKEKNIHGKPGMACVQCVGAQGNKANRDPHTGAHSSECCVLKKRELRGARRGTKWKARTKCLPGGERNLKKKDAR